MAAKNPKVVLDEIVKVILLLKAAASFASITAKGHVGHRFAFVNRLKADMAKKDQKDGILKGCQTNVQDIMERWDLALERFRAYSAQEDDWTVEAGVSMTTILLNMAPELDIVHTAMSQVWDAVKKARKVALAAAVKENSATKASNVAIRPFTKKGVGAAWKALLFQFNLVTTGHVLIGHDEAQSQEVTDETTTVIDWSNPHYWYGQLVLGVWLR